MFKTAAGLVLAVSLIGVAAPSTAAAQTRNNRTILTFSQPIEVPGRILPAGTYTFQLADSLSDRHVVQIFNADGSEIITTILAINNYRMTATDKTVVTFNEAVRGEPEAIRAWFYPGNNFGQEFVYPRDRAVELAVAARTVVPAVTVANASVEELRTVPLVAITPERREAPIAAVIQTTPVAEGEQARLLPRTASALPLIALFGLLSVVGGLGLRAYRKPAFTPIQ